MARWEAGTFKKWSPPEPDNDLDDNQDGEGGDENDEGGEGGKGGEPTDDGKPTGKPEKKSGKKDKPSDEGDWSDIDDITKEIEDGLSKREEISTDKEAKDILDKDESERSKSGGPSKGEKNQELTSIKSEVELAKPTINWKNMIKIMVSSSKELIDTSYAKPSRKSITGLVAADVLGGGAISPGEITEQQNHNKIVIVIDTSGSMRGYISMVLAEVQSLLKRFGKEKFPIR